MRFSVVYVLVLAAALAQNFDNVQIDRVAARLRFAEGPSWSPEHFLVFSDVPNDKVLKWTPGEGVTTVRENAGGPSGTAFDSQGRLYVCESHARRVTRQDKKGRVEVIADKWEGKKLNAPNDIVVRKDGHLWFTDPAFGSALDHRELDFFGVFHVTPKGQMELVTKSAGRPNGVTLSADGRTLFVSNSDDRSVHAWDVDKSGTASNERAVILGIAGVPGGIRLDEKGNLYVAAKELYVYSPAGQLLHQFPLSAPPSNCAFGEADYQSLFITSGDSVFRARLDVKGALQY